MAAMDMVAPASYLAMLHPLRAGAAVSLDVHPRLQLDMTLGIIRLSHRTLVPATEHAFAIVRAYFSRIASEVSAFALHGAT